MPPVLFVDIWSDVVCPFCYLGFHQFHDALSRFENGDDVVVRHHAFELDVHAPSDYLGTLNEILAEKYSMPIERAAALNRRMEDSAREWGMEWSLELARYTNSFDAHRVIALAARQELQDPMLERLFRAYFSDGLLVSDHDTLARLAAETHVDGVESLFAGDDFADSVRHDESLATKIGITGVPALIFDGRIHVSGAKGADVMLDALHRAWSESSEMPA
jgi:predicted DsbA family dithiol-disulfide isomerase